MELELPSQPGGRRRQVALWTILAATAVNVALVATANETAEPSRLLLASVLLWICVIPVWQYFDRGERRIPFLPAMSAIYFLFYGAPAFRRVLKVRGFRPTTDMVVVTLLVAAAGIVLLFVAFYAFRFRWLPRARLHLDLTEHAWRFLLVGWASSALRLPGIKVPLAVGELIGFIGTLPTTMCAALLLLYLRDQLPRAAQLPSLLLFLWLIALDFSTGSVSQPALTSANLVFIYIAERGRLPLAALTIAALLLVPALGTKFEYRHQVAEHPEYNIVDKIALFGGLIGGVFTGTADRTNLDTADEATESRTDHLSMFSYVVATTPEVIPYWEGATYRDFLWSFVPRALVPSKPKKTLGQDYGHRYRILYKTDHVTSINLEQTVEMFANFGVLGVLGGMFFLGLLYRAIYEVLGNAVGDGGILIAANIFRVLLNIESDFSLVFGSIAQHAFLLYVVLRLLAGRTRPERRVTAEPGLA